MYEGLTGVGESIAKMEEWVIQYRQKFQYVLWLCIGSDTVLLT